MSLLKPKSLYRYAVLEYQPSLKLPNSQRLALVLQGPDSVVVMVRDPSRLRGVSEVARAVLDQLPALLSQQVEDAIGQNKDVDVLAGLQANNRWNIYLGKPDTVKSAEDPLELAFQLFIDNVVRREQGTATKLQTSLLPSQTGEHATHEDYFMRRVNVPAREELLEVKRKPSLAHAQNS